MFIRKMFLLIFLFFISIQNNALADKKYDFSMLLESAQNLLEKNQYFDLHSTIELVRLMQKHVDIAGVKRVLNVLKDHSKKINEFGNFTFIENEISKAFIFIGENQKARTRLEQALAKAKLIWSDNELNPLLSYYPEMIAQYIKLGGDRVLEDVLDFAYGKTKNLNRPDFEFQNSLAMALMWAELNEINKAQEDFIKTIEISKRGKKPFKDLLNIASWQGRYGLFDEMSKTIDMLDITNPERRSEAWRVIQNVLKQHKTL